MNNPVSAWFDWLQKGAPSAPVERYPQLSERGETSLPGVFVLGDLTGIPLLKLAAESGYEFVERLVDDKDFNKRRAAKAEGVRDLLIIGAGPAGVAAALTAGEQGLDYEIVESTVPFNTIVNFPKGKPIFAEPSDRPTKGPVDIRDTVKEALLEQLGETVEQGELDIRTGVRIESLRRDGAEVVAVDNGGDERRAVVVALAIGKSGDSRKLGVPGEELPHVANRLFDPGAHANEKILIVGGGDSAIEAAVALANGGNSVVLSYRKSDLTRPKEGNQRALQALSGEGPGRIQLRLGTTVERITADEVELAGDADAGAIPATSVYVLIGRQMPLGFFKRCSILMEGEWSLTSKLLLAVSLLFANVIYFGKSMPKDWIHQPMDAFAWPANSMGVLAWGSMVMLPLVLLVLAGISLRPARLLRATTWNQFKWGYFATAFVFFCAVFFASRYGGVDLLEYKPSFWYGVLYCVTMTTFGLRRVHVRPTPYIKAQTAVLVSIQWTFLWLLPEIVIPWAGEAGFLGGPDGYLRTQVFPGDSWWRAYGFILAWPLFMWNLSSGEPTTFWLVASLVQTGVLIPLGIWFFGKGVYCGWICSCGGLAETLGDEYRTKALHGPLAKRWENAGQVVLLLAFVILGMNLSGVDLVGQLMNGYWLLVDMVFAGVLGIGVYFFLSGRVWCRFLCPLAALMHVYTKFTTYRIFSRKKRCISCNICTKVCHMGIDVMSYAVRGKPMDDVECVRCSACVVNCPMDVLAFGRIGRDGELIPPKLHATLFEPVNWAEATDAGHVHASYPPTSTDTYIHDPVKQQRIAL